VLSGAEAVARTERILVGDALARAPAVAEGLVLAGVRAASVAGRVDSSPSGDLPAGVSCVHHVTAAPGSASGGSFELAATSAQEAVDDCIAAHLLSQRLGRPGSCSLAPNLADDLAVVQLPDASASEKRLADAALSQQSTVDPDSITELACEALMSAGGSSELPAAPVVSDGDAGADLVLVAAGESAAAARAATRALAEAGVRTRAAIVRLMRPFPADLLRQALAGARMIVAVDAPGEPLQGFIAAVRAASGAEAEVRGVVAKGSTELIEVLRAVLPARGFDVSQLAAPEDPPLAHRLVVAPDDDWGEATARRALALLATEGALRLGRRKRRHRNAAIFAWDGGAVGVGARDLLIASHPGSISADEIALLRPQSPVLVLCDASSPEALLRELSPEARGALREREHPLYFVACSVDGGPPAPGRDEGDASRALAAAAFAMMAHPETSDTVALQSAEGAIHRVDDADLAAAPEPQELDVGARSPLPRMPEASDDPEAREDWARWLRRFRRGSAASLEHSPPGAVRPAVFAALADELQHDAMQPFVLSPDADATPPLAMRGLRDLLADTLGVGATGRVAGTLEENLTHLAGAATRALARAASGSPLDALLVEAGEALVSELALVDDETESLREDLAALRAALPDGARVFDLRSDTPVRVYLEVLAAVRAPLERRFGEELAQLREVLLDKLQLDRMRSDQGRSAESLSSQLGSGATRLLDPDALARTLPKDPGWAALDERQRHRLKEALAIIEDHLGRADPVPNAVFLRPPGLELQVPGNPTIEHPDPLVAAVGTFDGVAHSLTPLFRAARLARRVAARGDASELHDEMPAGFDWEALTPDELSLLPAVTVVTTGRRLRRRGHDSLSELLRSGRPVHVIVHDDIAAADEAEDISLYHLDLGHLVMAHREAFALASTLARPQLLVERLTRTLHEPRPGVVLVSLPTPGATPSRPFLAEAALWGRACPDFLYDPDAGPSWADRFDVAGNPQPECAWPIHQVRYLEDDSEHTMETAFTFADAVALEPAYRRHLRVIPRVAWQDEVQVPLAEFIVHLDTERGARGIPFSWVVDDAGFLQRAAVSRELALACRDRLRGWRVLQELGGFENAYAERAAAAAREAAEAEAARERAELEQKHAEALVNASRDGVREAMQRLAVTLLNPDAVAATAQSLVDPAAPEVMPAIEAAAAVETVPETKEVVAEEAGEKPLAVEAAYIDTILCTSCNECTNINSRLFKYDDNKQAFIADPSAGSFAQLVKAATLCPAKCIHPGTPRADDTTATPALIARAAKLG
jgi:ferredoxin